MNTLEQIRKRLRLWRTQIPYGVYPIVTGVALAAPTIELLSSIVLLGGAIAVLLAVHVADDIFGFLNGTDQLTQESHTMMGETKPLVTGEISLTEAWGWFALFIGIGLGVLLYFSLTEPPIFIGISLFTILWGYSYSGYPLKLSYHGLGETVLIWCAGIAPTIISYGIVTGDYLNREPLILGSALGFLFSAVLMNSNYADVEEDIATNRMTLTAYLYNKGGHNLVLLSSGVPVAVGLALLATAAFQFSIYYAALAVFLIPLYAKQFELFTAKKPLESRRCCFFNWKVAFMGICLIGVIA